LDIARNNWRARLWNWRQFDFGVGPGVALALDPSGRGDSSNYLADLTFHNKDFAKHWDVTAQLSYMDINTKSKQKLFPPGAILPIGSNGNVNPSNPAGFIRFPEGLIGNPEVYERHLRLDLSAFYTGFDKHRLRFATGYSYADLKPQETKNFGPGVINGTEDVVGGSTTDITDTPFIFVQREQRRLYYVSFQDEWALAPDWDLTAGIRYDHYSDFGNTVNPRLALVWQARHNLTGKLLYGRAFRAPSFSELFLINNPANLGNPNLKPENINTLELALKYQPTSNLDTALSLFAYRINDLIRFVPEPGGTSLRAQNTGSQTGYGLEIEADWRIAHKLRLSGHYAFQRSSNEDADSESAIAPHHQGYLRAGWDFYPNWSFNAELNWIGERQRVAGDPRSKLDGYTIVDLTLRRMRIATRLELSFSVRNLFDQDAREPSPADLTIPAGSLIPGDFPLPGRSFFVEARYHF
jgi:iron complex outermembrane receptor protein